MTKKNLTNYYLELLHYFQVFGTMLDIGCGNLKFLFQFDTSKFKRLIGFDIKLPKDPFECYLDIICPDLSVFEFDYLEKKFWSRYRFLEKDILDFHIKKNHYGFIFCKHFIHFIEHELQLQLIEDFYSGLKNKGILFLKIDHFKNPKYTDTNKVVKLTNNCYKEKFSGIIQYPCNPSRYIQILTSKYNSIFTDCDEKSITLIIRKNNNC